MVCMLRIFGLCLGLLFFCAGSALATVTTFDSKRFGPAMVAGLLGGAKTSHGLTPTDVYDPIVLGDALIYSYYNVRNGEGNLFNIVNSDANNGQRVKIKFFEGKSGVETLSFDICLAPNDMWLGYILKDSNGVARLYSLDRDTYVDYGNTRGAMRGIFASTFTNGVQLKYGALANNITITADQTLEGFYTVTAIESLKTVTGGGNCGPTLTDAGMDATNTLYGFAYNINLITGKTFAYPALAIANFNNKAFTANPLDTTPTLKDNVDGLDGINFILTKESLSGVYYTINAGTQIILTFPTRHLTQVLGNDNDIFDDAKALISFYDDTGKTQSGGCNQIPCIIGSDIFLPYSVNVIRINNSSIFNSKVDIPISTGHQYGIVSINFVHSASEAPVIISGLANHRTPFNTGNNPTLNGHVAWGMPVIGYIVSDLGGGWNWMLPMFATYYVNGGASY